MRTQLDIDKLMLTRGVLYKVLLDGVEYRTAEEIALLSEFLEWLHGFQDAHADGHDVIQVHLR